MVWGLAASKNKDNMPLRKSFFFLCFVVFYIFFRRREKKIKKKLHPKHLLMPLNQTGCDRRQDIESRRRKTHRKNNAATSSSSSRFCPTTSRSGAEFETACNAAHVPVDESPRMPSQQLRSVVATQRKQHV